MQKDRSCQGSHFLYTLSLFSLEERWLNLEFKMQLPLLSNVSEGKAWKQVKFDLAKM